MDSTTGGDANDEFARWLAETAREQQEGAPPPAQAPVPGAPVAGVPASAPPSFPPPAGAAPDSAAYPAPPSSPPPAPEFFGADELAAPPARPTEPFSSGPPVARSSYLPPASPPSASPYGAEPSPQPGPTASEPPAPAPQPPAAPPQPPAPAPVQPAAAPEPPAPAWTPPAAAPEPPAAAPNPFFPSSSGAEPSWTAPPANGAVEPGAANLSDSPASSVPGPTAPGAVPGHDLPTQAYEPPAPTFQPPAYEPPVTATPFPAVQLPPATPAPPPTVADEGYVAPADPYGALFQDPSDTAARLASAPPPSPEPPPLMAPPSEPVPADEDPMKALFGLETEEQPAIQVYEPEEFAPPVQEPIDVPEQTYVPEPAYVPEQTYAPEQTYTPEPAYVPDQTYAPEPSYTPAPSPATASAAPFSPTPPADDDPTAGTQFFGGGSGDVEEPPDLDRATTAEKVGLALAVVLPPVGLVAGIVNAVQSSRERGWVHRLIRVSLVVAVIMSVVAGFAAAYVYKVADDARKHDQLAAASTQFCAAVAADPSMVAPPTFGFPTPAATIPDTITAFQAYVDKWTALAQVAPSGIRPDVNRVVDTAQTILDQVTSTRLVDNDVNQQQMSSVAGSTNIIGWDQEYCG